MANKLPELLELCKLTNCTSPDAVATDGFQFGCLLNESNTLLCAQPEAIPPKPALFCIGEEKDGNNKKLCGEKINTSRCFVKTGEPERLVLAADQAVCLRSTSSTSTPSSSISSTSTGGISSTSISGNSTTRAGADQTNSSIPTGGNGTAPGIPPVIQRGGLVDGAVAGVAIGALIAGALIAGAIFMFLLNRYRKKHQGTPAYSEHSQAYTEEGVGHEKGHVGVGQTAVAVGVLDSFLPQPAEDKAISGEMSKLRDGIKNHVQSYYITSAINPNVIDQSKFVDLAAATGLSTANIQALFLNPHSRMTAIRLYLAWVILSRCGTQKIGGSSFLPSEVASFATALSGIDTRNNSKLVLSTKWKAISAELLRGRHVANDVNIEQSIAQAMTAADLVLGVFVNSSLETTSDKRLRNLEGIMRRAVEFAFLLFSQPSIFEFGWAVQNGGIAVFPGLQQVVDENGNVVRTAFTSAEVVRA